MAVFRRIQLMGFRNVLQKVCFGELGSRQAYFSTGSQFLSSNATFKFSDLEISLTKDKKPKPDFTKLVFGKQFTDHMLSIEWSSQGGWNKPKIHPVTNLSLHPGSKVLHYAIEIFEGTKAYLGVDGKIRMFRPEMNMKRMLTSAARSSLPVFDGEEFIKCISKLIHVDADWVPCEKDCSLYIRPTLIGTEPALGVNSSNTALLYVLICPVGSYFGTGIVTPVTLLANPMYVRAWPGGVGNYKMGSNYGPTINIQKVAEEAGCQQVLWLYGDNHQLTEIGTMNIFMYWTNQQGEKELVTPPLNGMILPGITRKSLLDLGQQWNEFKISEKEFTMKDIVKGVKEKRIEEIFGAGTACIVSPVGKILYEGQTYEIPTLAKKEKSITLRFLKSLTDIQYGRSTENKDWVRLVE